MTRPICVFVLFGFFAQIIPPRGMSIWDLYKYTNRICPGFFLWLPRRGQETNGIRIQINYCIRWKGNNFFLHTYEFILKPDLRHYDLADWRHTIKNKYLKFICVGHPKKNTRRKRTSTQMRKRRHPKKLFHTVLLCICVFVIRLKKTRPNIYWLQSAESLEGRDCRHLGCFTSGTLVPLGGRT